jgi:branched-chain amino acid transport system permease protein
MRFDKNSRAFYAVLIIALLLLPFITDALFGRGWVRIVDFAMLYIMLALGLNIVVGYAGLLDLGYIAFFAVGAYCYALTGSPHLALAFPLAFPDGVHLSFWIVLPMAALLAGGFGVLLGAPTLRLRGDYLAIVTLGFGEIIRIFLNNLNAPVNLTNGPQGISRIDAVNVVGAPTLRLRGDYLAIVTLGFGEIIRIFLNNLNAPVNLTNGPQGISRNDPVSVANVSLNNTQKVLGIYFT